MLYEKKAIGEFHAKGRRCREIMLAILAVLYKGPADGFHIRPRVEDSFGFHLASSTLYPLLRHLDEEGYLTRNLDTKSRRGRKVCKITAKGRGIVKAYFSILQKCLENDNSIYHTTF